MIKLTNSTNSNENNFVMISGNTQYIDLTLTDETGDLLDLSGAGIEWGAKEYGDLNGSSIISKSLGNGITVSGVGKCQLILHPDDTKDLNGKYIYEFKVTDMNGDIFSTMAFMTIQSNVIAIS